jgi:gas vesicle protein
MAENEKPGTILAFVTGMGVGAIAALLLMPKTGEEMRKDVSTAISDSAEQLRERAKIAKDHLEQAAQAGTDAFKQTRKAGA